MKEDCQNGHEGNPAAKPSEVDRKLRAKVHGDERIALCHFMSVTDGTLIMENPNMVVNEDTEYIATIAV